MNYDEFGEFGFVSGVWCLLLSFLRPIFLCILGNTLVSQYAANDKDEFLIVALFPPQQIQIYRKLVKILSIGFVFFSALTHALYVFIRRVH